MKLRPLRLASHRKSHNYCFTHGFTLIESIISVAILMMGIVSLLNMYVTQVTLNEHARNATITLNDVTRVIERLRQQNSGAGCAAPSIAAPAGFASWDAWLNDATANGGGGKSVQPDPSTHELIVLSSSGVDPIQVTVTACWRHRERVIGECVWNGAQLSASDGNGDGVITSPVSMTTLVTCHST